MTFSSRPAQHIQVLQSGQSVTYVQLYCQPNPPIAQETEQAAESAQLDQTVAEERCQTVPVVFASSFDLFVWLTLQLQDSHNAGSVTAGCALITAVSCCSRLAAAHQCAALSLYPIPNSCFETHLQN